VVLVCVVHPDVEKEGGREVVMEAEEHSLSVAKPVPEAPSIVSVTWGEALTVEPALGLES
jgi:hypothetical protein